MATHAFTDFNQQQREIIYTLYRVSQLENNAYKKKFNKLFDIFLRQAYREFTKLNIDNEFEHDFKHEVPFYYYKRKNFPLVLYKQHSVVPYGYEFPSEDKVINEKGDKTVTVTIKHPAIDHEDVAGMLISQIFQRYVNKNKSLPNLKLLDQFLNTDIISPVDNDRDLIPETVIKWKERKTVEIPPKIQEKIDAHREQGLSNGAAFFEAIWGEARDNGISRSTIRREDKSLVTLLENSAKAQVVLPPKEPRPEGKYGITPHDAALLAQITPEQKAAVLREHNRSTQRKYRSKQKTEENDHSP